MQAGHLISIVDDDPSMREALAGLVRSLGYDVRVFSSAEAFLQSSELGQFSCAITDIQMPGIDGFELKRLLDLHHGALPVIMITARAEPDLQEKALQSGAVCFLRKPLDALTMAGCLEKALASRAEHAIK
ncbi:response regulator [Bradyrhizobium sp. CER78]|uniref:response regulator transcription factor n=1 Tax=Bradyrhizobium sp. CER78 TaxID=3039162 RepID=UPI0024481AFD|nr:response regulator [Bradyrhizobium sp. CER78]MDH2385513.1 response regulator [Bradyrhizobium sp. CER78]